MRMRLLRYPVSALLVHAGDKVKFESERQRYTVRAVSRDRRWLICTKPMNLLSTVLYTIVDFESNVRGPDDMVFSIGYESDDDIAENMRRLTEGNMQVSVRRDLRLDIERIDHIDCELAR